MEAATTPWPELLAEASHKGSQKQLLEMTALSKYPVTHMTGLGHHAG